MKQKFLVLIAILTVMCWVGSAGATTTYLLNLENTDAAFVNPPPFGEVNVTWLNNTTASIEYTTLAPPPPSGGDDDYTFTIKIGAVVNANTVYDHSGKITSAGFSVSNLLAFDEDGNPAANPADFSWNSTPNHGAQTFDSFDLFNLVINVPNQGHSDADKITFTLTNTSGTWATEADVLTTNADGRHVAAHEYSDLFPTIGGVSNTFIATDGPAVPIPPSALLMGSGLLGLALVRFRRA